MYLLVSYCLHFDSDEAVLRHVVLTVITPLFYLTFISLLLQQHSLRCSSASRRCRRTMYYYVPESRTDRTKCCLGWRGSKCTIRELKLPLNRRRVPQNSAYYISLNSPPPTGRFPCKMVQINSWQPWKCAYTRRVTRSDRDWTYGSPLLTESSRNPRGWVTVG